MGNGCAKSNSSSASSRYIEVREKTEKTEQTEEIEKIDKTGHPSIGVVRLDYDYPAAPGDIDSPDSFPYDVYYRVVPGLTFEMCQSGKMTPQVEQNFKTAIAFLENKGVSVITGDCGFMMYFQILARRCSKRCICMSALAQLPAVTCAYAHNEKIAIFTANGQSLEPMHDLIKV